MKKWEERLEQMIEQCKHDEPRAVRLGYRYYRLKDGMKIHIYAG